VKRSGLSDRERRTLAVGRLVESLPPRVRDAVLGAVIPAMLEWRPEGCQACGGPLDDPSTLCVETVKEGGLWVRLMHEACAEGERTAKERVELVN
jgi:hypothetical protein